MSTPILPPAPVPVDDLLAVLHHAAMDAWRAHPDDALTGDLIALVHDTDADYDRWIHLAPGYPTGDAS